MKSSIRISVCILIPLLFPFYLLAQSTSWTGTTSTNWSTVTNWTNGVPTSTTDAILGDASFTGINQPTVTATSSCKTLTIGGTAATTITLTKNLSVSGNITINSNGTIIHPASTLTLSGSWSNNGTYTTTSTLATVIFTGTAQSLGGTVQTIFRKLTINAGSVLTLTSNMSCSGTSSLLSISGTLNPNESPTYLVTADNITVNSSGVLKVNAAVFTANYNISTTLLLNSGSIVEYAATTTNQTVSSSYSYSTLRISGAGTTKTLAADLPLLRSTSASYGNLYVLSGTFDLAGFIANRGTTVAGGTLSVSNGAYLKIGALATFPASYLTNTLSLTSTVEYYGNDQTVAAKTYGNLILSGTSGAVTKTMPVTAFTVAGSFSSNIGSGTSVSYTAASNISVTGSINIGASTTFNGSSFSHSITGNWNNNGTFTPATSTITLKGANTTIGGTAVQNFNNLTITGSNITTPGITDINISGNLATSGSGTLTEAAPANLAMTGTTKTITGAGIVLDNLLINGVVTTSSSISVQGNISVSGSLIASAGIITMSGSGKSIVNTGTLTFKGLLTSGSITTSSNFTISSSLNCSGTLTATAGIVTFTSTSLLSGTVGLFNVTINATSLSLSANSVLGIAGSFVITAGSFNATSYIPNTVNYNGAGAQTIKGTIYNNLVLSNAGTKTAGAAFTVNNTLTISPSVTFDAVSFTHTIAGNWINNGTFTAGTSTIQFTGTTNATITGVSVFNIITINKSLTTYSVSLQSNINVATINMTLGSLYTGANTLTITTTRTGNGIILGTITRTHAFVAATAYAFEGPSNLVTFAAGVSGVTSVTVNVTVAPVTDFPYNGAIGRTYTITIPSGTYTSATLRLHYEDGELNGNDESIMQFWKYNGAAWVLSGKTSNSTTSNYVEKTALTNITGRWTMTDDGSVLNWNGSVSSDWSVAGNWTLVQGTFSGAPGSTDIAQIGIAAFTNQPVITTAANVKSITLGSVQPVTITLNAGGSLIASGSIGGVWASDATHTINVNAQTLTINNDLSLSDNTVNHSINLNISTGTVSILGTLTQSGNANINFTAAGTLNIGKNFNYSSGTFTPSTGLVKYNGTLSQVVAAVPYYNLTVIKLAGTIASLSSPCSLAGSLTVSTGEFDVSNSLTVAGSVSITAGAILDAGASTITVGGNWTKSGTFNAGTGTVLFNGAGTQTISAGAFNILTFNKSAGTAVLSGNNTVNSDLSLLAGTLNLSTYTLNQSSAGDVFSIADGATLLVSGSGNFPTNFTTYTIGTNSLVQYDGTIAQTVADVVYGNITFSNGGALEKTFAGSSTINGTVTINSGASLNGGNFIITLNGNWINSGGTFNAGTGDILLNGTAKTITGNTTFNDVTVNGSYSVVSSDITFNGNFQVTPSGSYVAGSGVATINADFTNSGSVSSTGTTTFTGTVLQNIRLLNALLSTSTGVVNFNGNVSPVLNSTSTPVFATLNINNTAGINPSVNWVVLVAFNVSSGAIFNGGVSTHTFSRAFTNNGTVTSNGTLNFNPTTPVTLQLTGTTFSSTGTVLFGGSGAITISGTPTSLQDVVIANTNSAGIAPPSGWTINGKFSVNSNAIFNAGSYSYNVGGDVESDGTLNGGTSTFTMTSAAGQLSSSPVTVFNHFTITGSITPQTDFRVGGDFTNNGTYDGSVGVLIMTGSNAASIAGTTAPSTIAQLLIEKTGGSTVTQNVNINSILYLNIVSGTLFTSTRTLVQDAGGGILLISSGATLKLGGTNSLPGFSAISLDVNSNVDYAGTTQTVGNAADYGNLLFSAAGNKNALVPIVVRGNLSISAGTLATLTATVTHTIAGNFIMTGGALSGTSSTYLLNGSADQTLTVLSALINLTVNKTSGQVLMGSNATINLQLNMIAGNISLGNYDLTIGTAGTIINYSASKYIIASGNGSLIRQVVNGGNTIYPVGSVANYLPATVALTAASVPDNISVRVFSGVYDNGSSGTAYTAGVVNNSWMMSEATAGGSDATITIQWPASLELIGFTRSSSRLAHHDNGAWQIGSSDLAASGSNPYTLSRSGFTTFSVFTAGIIDVLPVTWLEMYGEQENDHNTIFWGTANETNNLLFVIEASTNGRDFSEIGRIAGQINSGSEQHYHFTHNDLKSDVYYYRIKQVDIDGKSSYSKIIRLSRVAKDFLVSGIYPVPAKDHVTLEMTAASPRSVTIMVINLSGTLMKIKHIRLDQGLNPVVVDLNSMAGGTYVIKVIDDQRTLYNHSIIKL